MALFSLFFLVIFFSNYVAVFCVFDEPVCSKFHFEEKVLEKLINLEVNVNHELKKMAEKSDNLETVVTGLNTETADLSTKLIDMSKKLELTKKESRENREYIDQLSTLKDDLRDIQTNLSVLGADLGDRKELEPIFFVAHGTPEDLPKDTTVVYQTILSNKGDGYNRATRVFTAPRNGVYIFSAQICSDNNVFYQIQVNDVPHSSYYQYSDTYGVCSGVSTTALLSSADQVAVVIKNAGVLVENVVSNLPVWNMFSGTLVS